MSNLDDLFGDGRSGGIGDLIGSLAGGTSADETVQEILGGLSGGGAPGGMGGVLAGVVPLIGGMLSGGGLQKVLAGLEANGLGAQAASWVGLGANQPIAAADVERLLGRDHVAEIAGRLGISDGDAAGAVANALPAMVDDLTPEGLIPSEDEIDDAIRRILGG